MVKPNWVIEEATNTSEWISATDDNKVVNIVEQ